MKLIKEIFDKDILGTDGIADVPPRGTVRALLLDSDGKIVLMHIEKNGYYTVPGGGIDPGETPEEALRREVLEEAGCECKIVRELGLITGNSARYGLAEESFCYLATVTGKKGEPAPTDEEIEEGAHPVWKTPHEAHRLMLEERQEPVLRYLMLRDAAMLEEAFRGGYI